MTLASATSSIGRVNRVFLSTQQDWPSNPHSAIGCLMPTNRINSLQLRDLAPVTEPIDLELDPRCNLLIGPNGCGKSTLLRAIVTALQNPECWRGTPFRQPSVAVDLQHETSEVASARPWPRWYDPGHSALYGYHDQRFKEAELNHEYFGSGRWKEYVERTQELPEYLKVPFLYIPATRLPFPRKDDIVSAYVLGEDIVADGVFDGRRAFRNMERFDNPDPARDLAAMGADELKEYETRTRGNYATADEWERLKLWPALRNAASARKQALLETTMACAARICSDVLKPDLLSQYSHSTRSGLRAERGISEVTYSHWLPHTYDDSDDPMTIGELSAGTQGPLMWLWYVVAELHDYFVEVHRKRLTHHRFCRIAEFVYYINDHGTGDEYLTPEQYAQRGNPSGYAHQNIPRLTEDTLSWEEYRDRGAPGNYCAITTPLPEVEPDEWRRMPFILLMDEIENHLHPAWQRRVIPALLETFPKMQLIATTHSPFVVAGRESGQVHRLYRDQNRLVRAKTSAEDILGWTVEDILREFMEVPDPTDEATSIAATVLRWIRNQEPEDGKTAEEWCQTLMSQLSAEGTQPSVGTLVTLGWLQRLSIPEGSARDWWEVQITELEAQVNPVVEFHGRVNADRERYIAELEETLWSLEDRLGEDLL